MDDQPSTNAAVINNTVVSNATNGVHLIADGVLVRNTIVAYGAGRGVWDVSGAAAVSNCNVFGNATNYVGVTNPANPVTVVPYRIPVTGGPVDLAVFDVAGRRVRQLVDNPWMSGDPPASSTTS